MEQFNLELVDWSRAQFALTAIYHWFFVPLTLGLSFIVAYQLAGVNHRIVSVDQILFEKNELLIIV